MKFLIFMAGAFICTAVPAEGVLLWHYLIGVTATCIASNL